MSSRNNSPSTKQALNAQGNNSRIFDSVKNDKNSNPDFNYKKKKE